MVQIYVLVRVFFEFSSSSSSERTERFTSRRLLGFLIILRISSENKDWELDGGVDDDPSWPVG